MRWEYETTHLLHFLMFLQFMFESNVDILVAHLFSFLGFLLLFCFGFCCCCCFVSCVPSVPSVFVLYLVCPVFPVSSSCVLCAQCSQCLRPVSCVPSVLSVFVLCLVCPILPVSLDCAFLIALSVFFDVFQNQNYIHVSPSDSST